MRVDRHLRTDLCAGVDDGGRVNTARFTPGVGDKGDGAREREARSRDDEQRGLEPRDAFSREFPREHRAGTALRRPIEILRVFDEREIRGPRGRKRSGCGDVARGIANQTGGEKVGELLCLHEEMCDRAALSL